MAHPPVRYAMLFLFFAFGLQLDITCAFTWEFVNSDARTGTLLACQSQPIKINSPSTGPYSVIALAVDATPATTQLVEQGDLFSYTPVHPANSTLILTVVDARGNSGGTPSVHYFVSEGSSTDCILPSTQGINDFTVKTSQTSGVLETCEPWELMMEGGKPPYFLSIIAPQSSVITNVTLSPRDNMYSYINRANPGGELTVGVRDSTGRWASGTPLMRTTGGQNTTCPGANSFSSSRSLSLAPTSTGSKSVESATSTDAAAQTISKSAAMRPILLGVLIPVILLICGGIFFLSIHIKRRRSRQKGIAIAPFNSRMQERPRQTAELVSPVSPLSDSAVYYTQEHGGGSDHGHGSTWPSLPTSRSGMAPSSHTQNSSDHFVQRSDSLTLPAHSIRSSQPDSATDTHSSSSAPLSRYHNPLPTVSDSAVLSTSDHNAVAHDPLGTRRSRKQPPRASPNVYQHTDAETRDARPVRADEVPPPYQDGWTGR